MATQINQLGSMLAADIVAWGSAVIGIALTASAVVWVLRLLRGGALMRRASTGRQSCSGDSHRG